MLHRNLASIVAPVIAAVLLASGCSGMPQLTEPAAPDVPEAASPPSTFSPQFPALARPGTVYRADDSVYDLFAARHGSRLASRYVLYADGTFALQFSSKNYPFFEYPGSYSSNGTEVLLNFHSDARWQATAALTQDSLAVKYNIYMSLSDFIDAVYKREVTR